MIGVDSVRTRQVILYKINNYRELIIDFLINTNMYMFNGLFEKFLTLTRLSQPKVCCICSHQNLYFLEDFMLFLPPYELLNRKTLFAVLCKLVCQSSRFCFEMYWWSWFWWFENYNFRSIWKELVQYTKWYYHECNTDQTLVWKKVGKVGKGYTQPAKILFEIVSRADSPK